MSCSGTGFDDLTDEQVLQIFNWHYADKWRVSHFMDGEHDRIKIKEFNWERAPVRPPWVKQVDVGELSTHFKPVSFTVDYLGCQG